MRKTRMLWLGALATLLVSNLYVQDIGGDWQGALKVGALELRIVVQIAKVSLHPN